MKYEEYKEKLLKLKKENWEEVEKLLTESSFDAETTFQEHLELENIGDDIYYERL